jgi:hypothetical protein
LGREGYWEWSFYFGPTFFAKLKNFFAKLIFFPPKLFLVFWKREIFLSKKNFGGKKST